MTPRVFSLANGDWLVISSAEIRTVVYRKPFETLELGIGLPTRLRYIADVIEEAMSATGPLERRGACENA